MKNLFLSAFILVSLSLTAQVTSVDYLMKYNCETSQYDVHIVVLEGTATTIPQRAQFNSQVTVVVPTGTSLSLTESYMPLKNNQQYDSNIPQDWIVGTPLLAPSVQPESDFYSITPFLTPAAFYNDLAPGDIVKIFSLTIGDSGEYDENIRFYNNQTDPTSEMVSMGMGDFSNGFTLGGPMQLFNDGSLEYCLTHTQERNFKEISVYPNPFQDQITIDLPEGTVRAHVVDLDGRLIYQNSNNLSGQLTLNMSDFSQGVYIVQLKNSEGVVSSKRVLKI